MRQHFSLVVLLVLLNSVSSAAQSHPCDQPPQTVATKGSRVGWCVPVDDLQANWHIVVNGAIKGIGQVAPVGNPSTAGLYYLEAPIPATVLLPKGIYPVTVFGQNAEGNGPNSDPVLWQIGGPPTKPEKPRIVGGNE